MAILSRIRIMAPVAVAGVALSLLPAAAASAQSAAPSVTPQTADIVCKDITTKGEGLNGYPVPLPARSHDGSSDCFLTVGDVSIAVRLLQEALKKCNGQNITADGIYGSQTKQAVKNVQIARHIDVDGIYGNQTRNAMIWPDNHSGACTGLFSAP